MTEAGWSNYFMHSRVGLVTGYLSDEWMNIVRSSAEKCSELGVDSWLYDEDKWPSGFAGGLMFHDDDGKPLEHTNFRGRALVLIDKDQLNAEFDTVLGEHDGKLICERVAQLGENWFNGYTYADLMNPDAVRRFIDVTHEKYKSTVGDMFGKEIKGIFTDEPCYVYAGSPWKAPYLQWSSKLPEYFERTCGYDLIPHVASLFFKVGTNGKDWRKVRHDYYRASTMLCVESFSKQYGEWCEDNNLKMCGHMMSEDELTYQTRWVGGVMPHYEHFHWPGIDKLSFHLNQLVTVKQVTSVADQLGKERAMCEVFGCIGQQHSFAARKWIGDWQAALGINFANSHLTLYSMRGERKRDYPANFSWAQPWWECERPYADYTARLSWAVTQGKREVDVLVIHPLSSCWCLYDADDKENEQIREKYSRPFDRLSKAMTVANIDYHYGDEILMEKYAKVVKTDKGTRFVVGEHEYKAIIVPPALTLSANTVKLLGEFAAAGMCGNIVYVGGNPTHIDGVLCDELDVDEGMMLNPEFSGITTPTVESAIDNLRRIVQSPVETLLPDGKNAATIFTHLRTSGAEQLLFLCNTDYDNRYDVTVRMKSALSPSLLDMFTGEELACPHTRDGEWVVIPLRFDAVGSVLVRFSADSIAVAKDIGTQSGGYPLAEVFSEMGTLLSPKFKAVGANSLVINYADVTIGGEKVVSDDLIAHAWHNSDRFYKSPEGTPFEVTYHFTCEGFALPSEIGEAFATIECAENLDSITLNGQVVKPTGEWWLDNAWQKVDISGKIQLGVNEIVIKGKKVNNVVAPNCHVAVKDFENHKPTEIEAVYVVGDFAVRYENGRPVMSPLSATPNVKEYPSFAGTLEYTATLTSDVTTVELTEVTAAAVRLYVDDTLVGTSYFTPHKFNVTAKAGSTLKAVIYPTLFNLTGPTWVTDVLELRDVNPWTFLRGNIYTNDPKFVEYGMSGFRVK